MLEQFNQSRDFASLWPVFANPFTTVPGSEKTVSQQTSLLRRIPVIGYDRDITDLVQLHLQDSGCDVLLGHDGVIGLESPVHETEEIVR